ncbi:MAG: hypothetical protein RL757_1069 [Bacteroidota bacterium]|jgi:preprotein translocase subunit YajC
MLFLQVANPNAGWINLAMPVMMIGVLYFFMWRPQAQARKATEAFQDSIERGKDVVTASGIIGKINKIEKGIVTLQVAPNSFIKVTKSSISREMTEAFDAAIKETSA